MNTDEPIEVDRAFSEHDQDVPWELFKFSRNLPMFASSQYEILESSTKLLPNTGEIGFSIVRYQFDPTTNRFTAKCTAESSWFRGIYHANLIIYSKRKIRYAEKISELTRLINDSKNNLTQLNIQCKKKESEHGNLQSSIIAFNEFLVGLEKMQSGLRTPTIPWDTYRNLLKSLYQEAMISSTIGKQVFYSFAKIYMTEKQLTDALRYSSNELSLI
jgi:hypothetical protein